MSQASDVALAVEDPGTPEGMALIAKLDDYLTNLYPPESNHLLSVESLRKPNATFLVARLNGRTVGCGAFVVLDRSYAELKRMFVDPELRGLGIGKRILEELESRIRALGLASICLETGVAQPEAIGLYAKSGYRVRGPFGVYFEDPLSIFMEKALPPPFLVSDSRG